MGICEPLPTEIETCEAGERERSIPSEECMWVEAPESITHGEEPCSCICCSAAMRPAWSHVCVGCWYCYCWGGVENCRGRTQCRLAEEQVPARPDRARSRRH